MSDNYCQKREEKAKGISWQQIRMLVGLKRGDGPFDHLNGMAQHGGADGTLRSLIKRGLVELHRTGNQGRYRLTKAAKAFMAGWEEVPPAEVPAKPKRVRPPNPHLRKLELDPRPVEVVPVTECEVCGNDLVEAGESFLLREVQPRRVRWLPVRQPLRRVQPVMNFLASRSVPLPGGEEPPGGS